MGFLLRMGWRNLLRNRRRTLLTASIIAFGLACLIFVDAFVEGMIQNMVATVTDNFLGQAQVHAAGFRAEGKPEQTVKELPRVKSLLRQEPDVAAFCGRVVTTAMLSSASDAESVLLYGIDPKAEESLSEIKQAVQEGQYLSGADGNEILLGKKLAKILQVHLGDRVVVTCAKSGSGDLVQEMFRVHGIFSFQSADMDRSFIFLDIKKAQHMMDLGENVQEIVLKFKRGNGSEPSLQPFLSRLSEGGNEALDWSRLMPDLKSALDLSGFSAAILAFLLAAFAALAILNTLFTALYERMFEFGVLRALGTRPSRMALLVLSEAACLGFLSVLLGTALGAALTLVFSKTGFDYYSGIEMAGVTFRHAIYPQVRLLQYTILPAGVWLFTVLVAIYPAWHTARILPAKAMHRSLG